MNSGGGIIYLDHGATSWPKAPGVASSMAEAVDRYAGNPGRSAHRMALEAGRAIMNARTAIARHLGVATPADLVFQPGCTYALNLALLGLLSPGDRVVACPTEHNAVARPLNVLASQGVEIVLVEADAAGVVDPDEVEARVAEAPTTLVVCQHAGNVSGAIQPIADLVDVAHAHGAKLVVDGAQAGGHIPVRLSELGVDAWACSGHKGLLGPQGVGLLYLAPDCRPRELVSGGTGQGASEDALQPDVRPDRYEAGTPNTPGILGLAAAVRYLDEYGEELRALEARLTRRLHEGVLALGGFTVLGPEPDEDRVPIVSIVHERIPSDRIAFMLEREYGIACRPGLHCSPWAHKVMGTLESGALRFGIGHGNTEAHIDVALDALRDVETKL